MKRSMLVLVGAVAAFTVMGAGFWLLGAPARILVGVGVVMVGVVLLSLVGALIAETNQ